MQTLSNFSLSPNPDEDNLTMSVSELGTDTLYMRPKFANK
jgi:hypothetical protein